MVPEQGLLGPRSNQGLVPYGAHDEFGQGCVSGGDLSQSCVPMGMHMPPYVATNGRMDGVAQGCMSFGGQGEMPSLRGDNQRTLPRFGGQGEVPLLPDDDSPPLPPPAAARQHQSPVRGNQGALVAGGSGMRRASLSVPPAAGAGRNPSLMCLVEAAAEEGGGGGGEGRGGGGGGGGGGALVMRQRPVPDLGVTPALASLQRGRGSPYDRPQACGTCGSGGPLVHQRPRNRVDDGSRYPKPWKTTPRRASNN